MQKHWMLVPLAALGMLQAGCNTTFNGTGYGSPTYFMGAPYYGGQKFPNKRDDSYYGDKEIGIPYYLAGGLMYYQIGDCYCYYRNKQRYYVKTLPDGGTFCHVMKGARQDTSK